MLKGLRQIGPAIVVAAVVLGPGSITTSTKVGAAFGYDMLWLLAVLLILLIGVASLAAWLGGSLEKTICGELSDRLGKWAGWVIGIAFFLIVAGFQSSNNIAVIAGIEPLLEGKKLPFRMSLAILIIVNLGIISILYLSGDLYKRIETIMKILILLMLVAFVVNLAFAKPSISAIFKGLVPDFSPFGDKEHLLLIMGLIGTTFSVAAAFYQGYLVREKGWGPADVKKGFRDSAFGMCVLAGVTSVIMITSAAVFYDKIAPSELTDAGKMSAQLKASMDAKVANWIFCFGFLAGAFSSFLVNAMIGGHVLSDGLGLGSALRSHSARALTTLALLIGMLIGIFALNGLDPTTTIVIAQASTVIGGPAVVAGLLYLGWTMYLKGERKPPLWMLIITSLAMVLTIYNAGTTAVKVKNSIQKIVSEAKVS